MTTTLSKTKTKLRSCEAISPENCNLVKILTLLNCKSFFNMVYMGICWLKAFSAVTKVMKIRFNFRNYLIVSEKSIHFQKFSLLLLHFNHHYHPYPCPSYIPLLMDTWVRCRVQGIRMKDQECNTMHQRSYHIIASLD